MDEQQEVINDPCIHCQSAVKFAKDAKPGWDQPLKCETCGFEPWTKVSQQPHGDQTMYCNKCQMYVKPDTFHGQECCPYHQQVVDTEEGPDYYYDEMDQDGEAL